MQSDVIRRRYCLHQLTCLSIINRHNIVWAQWPIVHLCVFDDLSAHLFGQAITLRGSETESTRTRTRNAVGLSWYPIVPYRVSLRAYQRYLSPVNSKIPVSWSSIKSGILFEDYTIDVMLISPRSVKIQHASLSSHFTFRKACAVNNPAGPLLSSQWFSSSADYRSLPWSRLPSENEIKVSQSYHRYVVLWGLRRASIA